MKEKENIRLRNLDTEGAFVYTKERERERVARFNCSNHSTNFFELFLHLRRCLHARASNIYIGHH